MHYCARGMDLVNTALATLAVKRVGIVAIPNVVCHKYLTSRVKQKVARVSVLSVHPLLMTAFLHTFPATEPLISARSSSSPTYRGHFVLVGSLSVALTSSESFSYKSSCITMQGRMSDCFSNASQHPQMKLGCRQRHSHLYTILSVSVSKLAGFVFRYWNSVALFRSDMLFPIFLEVFV